MHRIILFLVFLFLIFCEPVQSKPNNYNVYFKNGKNIKNCSVYKSKTPGNIVIKKNGVRKEFNSGEIAEYVNLNKPKNQNFDYKDRGGDLTIKRIETNLISYVNKNITMIAKLDLDTYYNFGYSDAHLTHFAFSITDDTGRGYVYGRKDKLKSIREQLLTANTPLTCKITFKMKSKRYESHQTQIIAELLSASVVE